MRNLFALVLFSFMQVALSAQQAVIPNWKPGDSWIVNSEALIPSDDKQVDEQQNVLVDTMRSSYRWKVEEATEDGFILSIQLLSYSEIKRVTDQETEDIISLLSFLKDLEPLKYKVTKEARVVKEAPKEGSVSALFSLGQKQIVFLNDSILQPFISSWLASYSPGIKPDIVTTAEDASENDEGEDFEFDSEFTKSLYQDMALEVFRKKVETLHMPFGTAIKQIGQAYSATDLTESELEQLGISAEMISMFDLEGTYLFNDVGSELEFLSNMSLDMQDMLSMFAQIFEDAFSEEKDSSGKKKPKKGQKTEDKPKASESIPSIVIKMKMKWLLDKATLFPTQYQMVTQSSVEEKGVMVNIITTDNTSYTPE